MMNLTRCFLSKPIIGKVKLSTFKGKKPVVVFFYPADNTPGCTKEACAFEKKAPDFKKLGAEVLGISSGNAADKEKFIRANKLNSMTLLIDTKDSVRNSWKGTTILSALLNCHFKKNSLYFPLTKHCSYT